MTVYGFVVIACVVGYLVGSIPWALIIGKTFYKIDIREHGSKNLGGTNAGRVLGRKAGIAVMFGDLSKAIIAFYLLAWIVHGSGITSMERTIVLLSTAPTAALGHSYPIFAKFKGGKIVSISAGFIICTNYYLLILGITIFFLVLALTRFVSLASMIAAVSLTALSFTSIVRNGMLNHIDGGYIYSAYFALLCLFLIFRHRSNIVNLIKKRERQIKWID